MDIKLSQCFIPVDDHDKALAFYRDVLGLEVRNDVKFEGMRWVAVGAPSQPDVDIVLEPPVAVGSDKSIRHPINEGAVADATAVPMRRRT
jgi:catechol 2,3-dioxygenase-like lactoylglutathione lyase family enzyme